MKFIFTCFFEIVLIFHGYCLAQNGSEIFPKGARSYGMANASTTISDAWSIFNNIGAMGRASQSEIFCGYDHRLGMNELTTLGAGAVIAAKPGNIGLSLSRFGGKLFHQETIGLGFANQFGIASIGIKASYLQTNMEGYGRSGVPVFELGGVAELVPQLYFGAHIYNFTRTKYSSNTDDYLPTLMKAGISYRPSSTLMINLEAEKDILLPALAKVGVEYNFHGQFWARCGIKTKPSNMHFGIGFTPERFKIDYALAQNNQLGYTHHFSMSYQLK